MVVDEATAFDFGMQMADRTWDENRVHQVSDQTPAVKEIMLDNLLYERIDDCTLDEKTNEPKFHRELVALFKNTEGITCTAPKALQNRLDTPVFPTVMPAIDAQTDTVSSTLALLAIMIRDVVRRNSEDSRQT